MTASVKPTTKQGTRTIAVASGKGGAGKTSVALALAWLLAESGKRVCLVDVDMGLSNVDVLLGITPKHTLDELFFTDLAPQDALFPIRPGLDIISGGSGTAALADLSQEQRSDFLKKIRMLDDYDILLLDNSPGIHRQVISFCLAAREQILVINPEPSSLMDGYALLKVLRRNGLSRPPYLLLNRVAPHFKSTVLMERFGAVCKQHLNLPVLALGAVPDDPRFRDAAARQMLPLVLSSASPAREALARAARLLAQRSNLNVLYTKPEAFWSDSLVNMLQGMSFEGVPSDPSPAHQHHPGRTQEPAQRSLDTAMSDLERCIGALERVLQTPVGEVEKIAGRMRKAGERLLVLSAKPAVQSAEEKARIVVGVVCSDQSLRQLLQDVLQERGYFPVVVNGHRNADPKPDVLLCSATKTDALIQRILREMAGVPWVWLSQYSQPLPDWASTVSRVEVLKKPFTLEEIDAALCRARSCQEMTPVRNVDGPPFDRAHNNRV